MSATSQAMPAPSPPKPRTEGLPAILGSLPLTLLFLTLVLTPLALTFLLSFAQFDYNTGIQPGHTLEQYRQVLTDSYFLEIFWRTFWIAGLTTLICALIGAPEAYVLSRMRKPWRSIFLLAVLSPLLISLVVRAFGWSLLLGPNGPLGSAAEALGLGSLLYTPTAIIIGLVHVMLPFMVIPVWTSLQKLDPTVEQAAYSLNASRAQTLWRVVLPQAMPGVLSGSLIVFGLSASSFAIPALLGGRRLKMAATIVYDEFLTELNWPLGAAIAVLLLVANIIIMMSYNRMVERSYRRSLG
ncbi:binding-protein-dependent transport system inner membrane protein [Bordetella ansorpii]|uniref:Binding-protein-dependent transport system inner membrane protein n=1 Tax=Bordetella ansorpii TaxID=288768 RepID=A0A157NG11_9BORD|nr:ABC transporter permease [Bordetella ansorpii]SAI20277.1 binding-protein-dependent transport system inner membrane protein [Bordetella ansorpii]